MVESQQFICMYLKFLFVSCLKSVVCIVLESPLVSVSVLVHVFPHSHRAKVIWKSYSSTKIVSLYTMFWYVQNAGAHHSHTLEHTYCFTFIFYCLILSLTFSTPFNNSLVRTRPALSRKILSLWMARAKLARAWPALFMVLHFYQHQSSARPAPGCGPKSFWTKLAPGPGLNSLHGQRVTRFPGVSRAGWSHWTVSEHFRLYMACPVTMTVIPLVAGFVNGLLKVARLCWYVCERNFLLLGADYFSADLVRTKDDELLKGVLVTFPVQHFMTS